MHYLKGGDGIFAIFEHKDGEQNMYYIHKDYLGSFETVTDNAGNVVDKLNFDPWGRRRNPFDGSYESKEVNHLFDRGFTGHQHMDEFGLINMGGRVFDPVLARFLSPDPFVQAPEFSQNFNRYTYAFNNPLKFTDPDGEFVHLLVGAAIGGVMNWVANGAQFNAQGLAYFGVGALAGGLAAGVGAGVGTALSGGSFGAGFIGTASSMTYGFSPGFVQGFSTGFTNGFIGGFGNTAIKKGISDDALFSGLKNGFVQGIAGGLMNGVSARTRAMKYLRDPWTGERTLILPETKKISISLPETTYEIQGELAEINPFYTNSELTYDGEYLDWWDNYSDGSCKLRYSYLARSGPKSFKPSSVYGGRMPNGNYTVTNLRLREINQKTLGMFTNDGFGFSADVNAQFSTIRSALRIHFDNTCFYGTAGCIGIVLRTDAMKFYNEMLKYTIRINSNLNLFVNY